MNAEISVYAEHPANKHPLQDAGRTMRSSMTRMIEVAMGAGLFDTALVLDLAVTALEADLRRLRRTPCDAAE